MKYLERFVLSILPVFLLTIPAGALGAKAPRPSNPSIEKSSASRIGNAGGRSKKTRSKSTKVIPAATKVIPAAPPVLPACEPADIADPCGGGFPWPKRITVRHVAGSQGGCVPFATDYTTYEMFLAPLYRMGTIMPFLDLRGHRFDNNTYAANIGIGGRSIPKCDSCVCDMFGFNAYYDYRQGCIGYYQQLGLGIEILGCQWDFRANAYAPFGNKRHISSCLFTYEDDYFALRRNIESVTYSFNGEIGCLLFARDCFFLYAAAGPYFLARGKCSHGTAGGEIRLRPQYKDYFAVDLSWRYDDIFKTIWQAEIIFSLPLYALAERNRYPCGISDRQIYQPVERFEVMPLNKRTCWSSNF